MIIHRAVRLFIRHQIDLIRIEIGEFFLVEIEKALTDGLDMFRIDFYSKRKKGVTICISVFPINGSRQSIVDCIAGIDSLTLEREIDRKSTRLNSSHS